MNSLNHQSQVIKPAHSILEFQGNTLIYKGYLKSKAFSYRCKNHNAPCKYLLTVPFNNTNYNPDTMECIDLEGAYQVSKEDHSELCRKIKSLSKRERLLTLKVLNHLLRMSR